MVGFTNCFIYDLDLKYYMDILGRLFKLCIVYSHEDCSSEDIKVQPWGTLQLIKKVQATNAVTI